MNEWALIIQTFQFFVGPTSSENGGTTVLSCYENGGKTASI